MKTLFAFMLIAVVSSANADDARSGFAPKPTSVCNLTSAELRQIGVIASPDKAYFTEPATGQNAKTATAKKALISPDMIQLLSVSRHKKEIPSKFLPVFAVVEYAGGSAAYYRSRSHFQTATKRNVEYFPEAAYLYSDPDYLIGVRFSLENGEQPASTVTLWYVPTQEFIDALPERYRKGVDNAVKGTGDEPYIQTDPSERKNFSFNTLLPNPATSGVVTANVAVRGATTLTITLFDLNGQKIAEIATREYIQGEHAIVIPLDNLPSGMYIVGIRSSAGQTEFERLMITR